MESAPNLGKYNKRPARLAVGELERLSTAAPGSEEVRRTLWTRVLHNTVGSRTGVAASCEGVVLRMHIVP